MALSLTARERAHLKARAHGLQPTVHVGHAAITDAVSAEIDRALTAHELIKVKFADADRNVRRGLASDIAERSGSVVVQQVGKVVVLWRPRPEAAASE